MSLPAPHTDRPALDDPVTAEILNRMRASTAAPWRLVVGVLGILAALGLAAIGRLGLGVLLVLPIWAILQLVIWFQYGRWATWAQKALAHRAWQEVPARVLAVRSGAVGVELAGEPFWMRGATGGTAVVIARTGRAWVVREGKRGAIRVEGAHSAIPLHPARRITPKPFHETDAFRASLPQVRSALATALSFGRLRLVREMERALDAGAWQWLPMTVGPWDARGDGTATAPVQTQAGAGEFELASVDLLGTIRETGGVWVAGDPVAGRIASAGFPGYPLFGALRIRG